MTSFLIGVLFSIAPVSMVYQTFWLGHIMPVQWRWYMATMALAHTFEYLFVARYHTKELKWDSFLINQSKAYVIAALVSWVEFWVGE